MRNSRFIIIAAILASLSVTAFGQVKIYTRKAMLEDFPEKVCKVVVSSESMLELAFKSEVSAHWKASSYEFCTPEFYQENVKNNSYYFLRMVTEKGVTFLSLTKGGDKENKDYAKRPVDVVSLAIASEDKPNGRELNYLGGFIDVIQNYAGDAMESDVTGYAGLGSNNLDSLEGYTVYTDPDKSDAVYKESTPKSLIYLCIIPKNIEAKNNCYKMLLSADTHELFMYEKTKYTSPFDAYLTKTQAKFLTQRGAKFAE